ncbi:MAG TPA: nitroreductase family protein [Longimicrobium sp.]|nr:nitroreductase family protein [Longimicrobium sp.]
MIRRLIRTVLSPAAVARLRGTRDRMRVGMLRVCSRSPLLSTLYYLFASRAFRREHQAVLYGRLKHEEDNLSAAQSLYRLRRNVHRLEKGLIMRPRRPVFAVEYIEETVHSLAARLGANGNGANGSGDAGPLLDACVPAVPGDPQEVRWARDVLDAYFEAASGHPAIERARSRFQALPRIPVEEGPPVAPYRRDLSQAPPVAYDDLLRLSIRRRSVRWFEPRPVPRELIDRAVQVAAQSPSACNRQPFEFRVFDDPDLARQVAGIPMGTRGFDHNFPVVVAVVGRLRAYFDEKDRHVIYIDGGLASMSFVLALETLGLASCCINWPDVEQQERAMASLLGLEPDERVIMLIALGWPDADALVPASGKKALDVVRRYNARGQG